MVPTNRQRAASRPLSAWLQLFGGFRLEARSGQNGIACPVDIPTAKGRALIAYLAVGSGARVTRERLSALLWGESEARKARQNLRQVLVKIERALSSRGLSILDIDKRSVGLRLDGLSVDIWDFDSLVAGGTPAALAKATRLYAGDFLGPEDFETIEFGEWLSEQRSRYQDLALASLSILADRQCATRHNSAAVGTLRSLLAIDPCHEPAHRQLMSLYDAAGMADVALAQYRTCKSILRRDLDVAPDTATEALYRKIQDSLATKRAAIKPPDDRGDVATDRRLPSIDGIASGPQATVVSVEAEWAQRLKNRDPGTCFALSQSLMLSGRACDAVAHARRALWRSVQSGRTDPFWFLAERIMFRMHLYAPRLSVLCRELTGRAADFLGRSEWRAALESLTANAMIAGLAGKAEAMHRSLADAEDLLARARGVGAEIEWHQVAGFGRVWSGDGGGACEHFDRALSLATAAGNLVRAAMLRGFRGRARLLDGPGLEAGRDLTAAIDMTEQLGHVPYAPLFHTWMAEFCFGEGLVDLGKTHADRAQHLNRECPQAWCHAPILRARALVYAKADQPDLARAARLLDQSRALQASLGFAPRAHNRAVLPELEDSVALRH